MSVYVAQVRGGWERMAAADLARLGVTAYVPVTRRWCYWAPDRRRPIERPLIAGYLFVWSDDIEHDLGAISSIDGFGRVLESAGVPLILEGDWLERIWWAHTFGLFDFTRTTRMKLSLGATVKIIGGQFQGVLAVLQELRGSDKVKVRIETKSAFGTLILRTDQLQAA